MFYYLYGFVAVFPPRIGKLRAWEIDRKGKFPKVLRGRCKRFFGPREQRSPKSLLRQPKLLLHRCEMGLHRCKRLFGDLCSLGPKNLLHPPLSTFGNFPFRSISQAPSFQIQERKTTSLRETALSVAGSCGYLSSGGESWHVSPWQPRVGKELAPCKIGKRSNPQNGAKYTVFFFCISACGAVFLFPLKCFEVIFNPRAVFSFLEITFKPPQKKNTVK